MVVSLGEAGFKVYPFEQSVADWAKAARLATTKQMTDPTFKEPQMRHGGTWFVGVDALANGDDGNIDGVPLTGLWQNDVVLPTVWHAAQVSVLYPGYPRQDADETDATHRYRITRFAAHVDGLLPVGPQRRRYLQEPHAFIVGLPLNAVAASPLMVWPGSHRVMGAAFKDALAVDDPLTVDLTDIYHSARRCVFEKIEPEPVVIEPGQAVVLHRHLLHGVAPWDETFSPIPEGRMIAYFRPEFQSGAENWRDDP